MHKWKKATLIAQGIESKLEYISSIGLEASPYLELRDVISLLLRSVEEIRVGDFPGIPDTTLRDFIIIVPIENLMLEGTVNIGDIEFYKKFNTIDDKIIGRSSSGKEVPEWISYPTRAKVIVNASELQTAIIEGYNKISTAIDMVTLRTDLSFPKLKIEGKYEYPPFYYNELVSQVKIPAWVYCRENDTDLWIILNLNFSKDNILKIEGNPKEYFGIVNRLFSDNTFRNMRARDRKSLLLALHWMRRSIQDGDKKDKMLDLWTAVELVISGTKANPLFCDELIESIIRVLNLSRESLNLTSQQEEVLTKKLRALNDTPLMTRIDALFEEYGINLTDEESELLIRSRKERNDVLHGRDAEISDKELIKLRSIIERLIIGKISLSFNRNVKH